MRGMLDFLEKAGLVTKDRPDPVPTADAALAQAVVTPTPAAAPPAAPALVFGPVEGAPLQLQEIYASAGVPASQYPAERLLRLVDGLSAMDAATRSLAIKAMDEADESWSINDPLSDAAAKSAALTNYAEQLQLRLQQQEQQAQSRLEALRLKQEQAVGEVRKQITELEALVARELARGAQETAAQEAELAAARNQTAHELGEIARLTQRLQSLAAQFAPTNPTANG